MKKKGSKILFIKIDKDTVDIEDKVLKKLKFLSDYELPDKSKIRDKILFNVYKNINDMINKGSITDFYDFNQYLEEREWKKLDMIKYVSLSIF